MMTDLEMLQWLHEHHDGQGYAGEEECDLEDEAWDCKWEMVPGFDGDVEDWEELDDDDRFEKWYAYLEHKASERLEGVAPNQIIVAHDYDLNSWALVSENVEYIRLAQACVAGLNNICHPCDQEKWLKWYDYNTFYLSGEANVPTDYQRAWVEYVIERSPYRHAFLIKDVDTAIKYGNAYDCTKWSANYIVGASTALRIAGEYARMARAWYKLRDVFDNEHLAFLVSQAVKTVDNGSFTIEKVYGSNHSIHSTYSGGTEAAWLNFISDDMSVIDDAPRMSESTHYGGLFRAWGIPRGKYGDQDFKIPPIEMEKVTKYDAFGIAYSEWKGVSASSLQDHVVKGLQK